MKIWSSKEYLRSLNDLRPILKPFWGDVEDLSDPDNGRFNKWINDGPNIFKMVDLYQDADFVIYPQDPTIDKFGFEKFQTITTNKPMFVFFNSDSEQKFNVRDNVYIFRTSCQKSQKNENEFGLPAWSLDWGIMPQRKWNPIPTIGFCGQSSIPNLRNECINILNNSNKVKTNFILRNNFWAGRFGGNINANMVRNEYINNIKNSDYVLCVRGGGNFSYRLYETMMSGRIPLFVDTDCLLPFDECIYNYFPIIQSQNINNSGITNTLLNFHNNYKNNGNFENHQIIIRKIWEEWLSPTGFFKTIHRKISK